MSSFSRTWIIDLTIKLYFFPLCSSFRDWKRFGCINKLVLQENGKRGGGRNGIDFFLFSTYYVYSNILVERPRFLPHEWLSHSTCFLYGGMGRNLETVPGIPPAHHWGEEYESPKRALSPKPTHQSQRRKKKEDGDGDGWSRAILWENRTCVTQTTWAIKRSIHTPFSWYKFSLNQLAKFHVNI